MGTRVIPEQSGTRPWELLNSLFGLWLATLGVACHRSQTEFVYVSNEDSNDVSVIDAREDRVVATIPVGQRPRGILFDARSDRLYVAVSGSPKAGPTVDARTLPPPDRSRDGIAVVNVAERRVERVLPSGPDPEAFDLLSDRGLLFVSNEETGAATVLDLGSARATGMVRVGAEPEGVRSRPDGAVVYVTSEADHRVDVVDAKQPRVVARVETGERPRAIAFSGDGDTAYVTNELSGDVTVIDAQRHERITSIVLPRAGDLAPRPMGIVVAPDGDSIYVTTGRGRSVVVLDARRNTVRDVIEDVGARPWGIGISADGSKLYVANGPSNDVAVIDVAERRVERRLKAGASPWGIAVSSR